MKCSEFHANLLYVSDSIGNRKQSAVSSGQLAVTNDYTANNLNQYSQTTSSSATNNFSFDADGNMLTNDGWTYAWNGENRLMSASNETTVLTFKYDYMGRRFEKVVQGVSTNTFIYDGWNLIQESNNSTTNNYVWGLDLSQTLQGAGGVGGLLSVTESDGETYFSVADANGNVTGYIDASGNVKAVYTFDAFGGIIASSGAKKDDFKFRFSTKYQDSTGLYYYGYRYYDAGLGRWLRRDPMGEHCFYTRYVAGRGWLETLRISGWTREPSYSFIYNNPANLWDYLGLLYPMGSDGLPYRPDVSSLDLGTTFVSGQISGLGIGALRGGGGLSEVSCCGDDNLKHYFLFSKVCIGPNRPNASITGGMVFGMADECNAEYVEDKYSGLFLEIWASYAGFTVGVDIGVDGTTGNIGVVEAGFGLGAGPSGVTVNLCTYKYRGERTGECCDSGK